MNANNILSIHGRLTRDPELKTTSAGTEYCRFTVAVDRYNGKDKVTDFFNCTAFGKTGVAINQYMTKGREIICSGSMESNTKETNGQKQTYWGVHVESFSFCGSKAASDSADSTPGFIPVDTDEDPFK